MTTIPVKKLISDCQKILNSKGIENSRFESSLIIQRSIKKTSIDLFLNPEIDISFKMKKRIFKNIYNRTEGKPVSKIFGNKEFFSNKFFVNSFVLDPRPESELIVELIINYCKRRQDNNISILELGIGSGCLIISILKELQNLSVSGLGVDLSCEALEIAKKNKKRYRLNEVLEIKKSNWFSNVKNKYDIIFSNPPYIRTNEIDNLGKEVKLFDPVIALDGGLSGLNSYSKIASKAKYYLKQNGIILLELGEGQLNQVNKIFKHYGYITILEEKDLQGINRVVGYIK